MAQISKRTLSVPASTIRKFVPYATEAKQKGHKVYHLNIGQPDLHTPKAFWNAIHDYPYDVLAYGNSQGLDEYIDELEKYYNESGIKCTRDNILVTTAGSEAIFFAMTAVTDPGDNIVVFEPFFTSYNGYAKICNINLNAVTSSADNGFHLPSREEIESKIDDRTKAILICTPNNPTGTVLRRDEMELLADIALKNDLFLISDEVYREFVYEGEHTSVLQLDGMDEHGIILDSISKRFSACGARIGNIVTRNKKLWDHLLLLAQARLCPPSIEQFAAKAVFESVTQEYYDEVHAEYKKRRDIAIEEINKIPGAFCKTPKGAFYIMVTLPVDDIEDFTKWMLTDFDYNGETTMVAPGSGFYATPGLGHDQARIAYVLHEDDLRKAIICIREGLKVYQNR